MISEDILFNSEHIIEKNSFFLEKNISFVSYFLSNNPTYSIIQELFFNENIELKDESVLYLLENLKSILFIESLFVENNFRNNGHGSKLIQYIKKLSLDKKIDAIFLIADLSITPTKNLISFYENHSFKLLKKIKNDKALMCFYP